MEDRVARGPPAVVVVHRPRSRFLDCKGGRDVHHTLMQASLGDYDRAYGIMNGGHFGLERLLNVRQEAEVTRAVHRQAWIAEPGGTEPCMVEELCS